METLQFKCTLLSDVIVNQKASTEGANSTLDFIPGNNFLGIVANQLYDENDPATLALFHQGKVRYGDAHPSCGSARSLKVPAAMYYPKLEKPSDRCFINHSIDYKNEEVSKEMRRLQLKQCRSGFYDFCSKEAVLIPTDTSFSIKSAHDITKRTSLDGCMYGYQSLRKGIELFFEVEIDDETLVPQIEQSLIGEKHIGRSKTSQFGLVKIEKTSFTSPSSNKTEGEYSVVYADARLIYIDKATGLPTLRPKADDLGIKGGEIVWEKSQIRTFQYSPWNFKRQCFDADRTGFEKGSVFIVKGGVCTGESTYTGQFKSEGFGKVIYNPDFLLADSNGQAVFCLCKKDQEEKTDKNITTSDSNLVRFLINRKSTVTLEQKVYDMVNEQVDEYLRLKTFNGDNFASQWGTIRSMATLSGDKLYSRLFEEEKGYLSHGVASKKWNKRNRIGSFSEFFKKVENECHGDVNLVRLAVINLAAEMAKQSVKENKKS